MEDLQAQKYVYRKFKEFVDDNFNRERKTNTDMTICSFDRMPPPGIDKLEIPFENIIQIDNVGEFERTVKLFGKGTELRSNVGVSTGTEGYLHFCESAKR
jgi:hypothetical protein